MEQTFAAHPYIELSLPPALDASGLQADSREDALMRLGHKGTHLDRMLRTTVPLEYFKSRAVAFDVSAFSQSRPVALADVPATHIRAGDFVLIRTGAMQRHGYGARAYMDEFFELSWEVIELFIERKVRFIGIHARSIRQNEEHREADARCEQAGIYVIENLACVEAAPMLSPFTVYAVWFDMGGTGIPCRVIADTTPCP
jgi:kynurenine formamidase